MAFAKLPSPSSVMTASCLRICSILSSSCSLISLALLLSHLLCSELQLPCQRLQLLTQALGMTAGQVHCCVDGFLQHRELPVALFELVMVVRLSGQKSFLLVNTAECRVQLHVGVRPVRRTAGSPCSVVQRPRWQLWQQDCITRIRKGKKAVVKEGSQIWS